MSTDQTQESVNISYIASSPVTKYVLRVAIEGVGSDKRLAHIAQRAVPRKLSRFSIDKITVHPNSLEVHSLLRINEAVALEALSEEFRLNGVATHTQQDDTVSR